MTERLPDTWNSRDFPVLREAARIINTTRIIGARYAEVAAATGLSVDEVALAAAALEDAGLVGTSQVSGTANSRITRLSGLARQYVGLWPSEETAADQIIAALEALAVSSEATEDTRSKARRLLDGFTSAGRDLTVAVAAAAISGQIPGSSNS